MAIIFRIFGVAAIAGAAILGVFGDWRGALAATLVGVGAFLSAPRRTAAQLYGWIGFAFICAGIGALASAIAAAVLFVGAVAFQFLAARRVTRALTAVEFEPVAADVVMPDATNVVQAFSSAGFTGIGGHRFRLARREIVITVLMNAEADRMAFVTDRVWQVASRYGVRWLVTSNSGAAPVPENVLRQRLDGATPVELLRAHDIAIGTIEQDGARPDRFQDPDRALAAARALERSAIAFVSQVPLTRTVSTGILPGGERPLVGGDADSRARIERWLAAKEWIAAL
jgi:hypothetical protein